MPNWTTNQIVLRGESANLQAFKQVCAGSNGVIDFNKLKPMPRRLRVLDKLWPRARPAWYGWNCREWGTKWNACRPRCVDESDRLTYRFDTAWDPPLGIIPALLDLAHHLGLSVVWTCRDEDDGGLEGLADERLLTGAESAS